MDPQKELNDALHRAETKAALLGVTVEEYLDQNLVLACQISDKRHEAEIQGEGGRA